MGSNRSQPCVFMETLWSDASCHSVWSRPLAGREPNGPGRRPVDGWGGWGYVTKHLASSFQTSHGLAQTYPALCLQVTDALPHPKPRGEAATSWNEPRWEGGIWTAGTLLRFKPTLLLQGNFLSFFFSFFFLAGFLAHDLFRVISPPPPHHHCVKHSASESCSH